MILEVPADAGELVHHRDIQRPEVVADPRQFRGDIVGGRNIAVVEMAEVQFHAGLHAPVERHFVYGDGALAPVHG